MTFFGEPRRVAAMGTVLLKQRLIIDPESVTGAIGEATYGRGVYYFHDLKPSVPVEVTAFDNFAGLLEYDGGIAVILANYTTFHSPQKPPLTMIFQCSSNPERDALNPLPFESYSVSHQGSTTEA